MGLGTGSSARKQTRLFLVTKHVLGHLCFVIEAMHLFTYSVHPREDKLADNGEHLSLRQGRLGQEVRNQVAMFAVYGEILTELLQGLARIFHSDSEKQKKIKLVRLDQKAINRCVALSTSSKQGRLPGCYQVRGSVI